MIMIIIGGAQNRHCGWGIDFVQSRVSLENLSSVAQWGYIPMHKSR